MRILVTGATGRVGRAIYIRLSRGHTVVGLDRAPSSTADIVGDLHDEATLGQALEGIDAVVHTAGLHAPQVGHVPDSEFERVNVAGTERLLNAALRAGVRRFVFTSTTALYGEAATPPGAAGWVDETLVPAPRTIYHHTKLRAEQLVSAAAAGGQLAATVLRMSRCFPEPASQMALYRLHRGVDARDVASAHQWAVEQSEAGCQHFVVSGATPFLRSDCSLLATDAAQVLRARAPALVEAYSRRGWRLPQRIDRVYVPDALRARGWEPQHGFASVLRQLDDESAEVLGERRQPDLG